MSSNCNPNKMQHFRAVVFSESRNFQNYDRLNHYFGSRQTNINFLKKQIGDLFNL